MKTFKIQLTAIAIAGFMAGSCSNPKSPENLVGLSKGIENWDDLIGDLRQSLVRLP